MEAELGLREPEKPRTRQRIAETVLRLSAERGSMWSGRRHSP